MYCQVQKNYKKTSKLCFLSFLNKLSDYFNKRINFSYCFCTVNLSFIDELLSMLMTTISKKHMCCLRFTFKQLIMNFSSVLYFTSVFLSNARVIYYCLLYIEVIKEKRTSMSVDYVRNLRDTS